MAGQLALDDRWTDRPASHTRTVPPSLAVGELRRGLAGGDPRTRIAQPALLVGSLRDPTVAEAEKVCAATTKGRAATEPVMCAACQAREARYGFRGDADDPQVDRPRTLCFECFRVEIGRRQEAAQAVQGRLPLTPHRAGVRDGGPALEQTLDSLSRRRRRAQIAARRALGLAQIS